MKAELSVALAVDGAASQYIAVNSPLGPAG